MTLSSKSSFFLPILYEDEDLMVCDKPSGLITDRNLFKKILQEEPYLVHRLDKETSGVILIAKNKKMQQELETLFRRREILKIYLALVLGKVKEEKGKIESRLEVKKRGGELFVEEAKGEKGQLAITYWQVLKRGKKATLLQCIPKTGRTHQIRVHLSAKGHPILGDLKYGGESPDCDRLMLHAFKIAFFHPKIGKKLEVISSPSLLFKSLLLNC
ncbi:MAG: RluA family pseudouridine synthase [Simkania negevensis]|nr:RluA family pseudouridine synthase [Simkania negevensis]